MYSRWPGFDKWQMTKDIFVRYLLNTHMVIGSQMAVFKIIRTLYPANTGFIEGCRRHTICPRAAISLFDNLLVVGVTDRIDRRHIRLVVASGAMVRFFTGIHAGRLYIHSPLCGIIVTRCGNDFCARRLADVASKRLNTCIVASGIGGYHTCVPRMSRCGDGGHIGCSIT